MNISNLLKFHKDSLESDITICAKEKINSSPFGQILFKGQKVKEILLAKNKNFINAGIYVFKKEVIKNILPKKTDITSLIE